MSTTVAAAAAPAAATTRVRLLDVAHARSGDKGDTANVGLIALRPEWYEVLERHATRERVAEHFRGLITGAPATDKLKVSIAFRSGWKAVGTLVYSWPDAMEKAELADRVLRERLDRLGLRFDEVLTEFVGAHATHGRLAGDPSPDLAEVQLRVGVRGPDRASVERFTREIAPLVLNGPPSVTGFAGGRPKVEEIVAYWPALVDKTVVQTKVEVLS